jgi:hypothetical protein
MGCSATKHLGMPYPFTLARVTDGSFETFSCLFVVENIERLKQACVFIHAQYDGGGASLLVTAADSSTFST